LPYIYTGILLSEYISVQSTSHKRC